MAVKSLDFQTDLAMDCLNFPETPCFDSSAPSNGSAFEKNFSHLNMHRGELGPTAELDGLGFWEMECHSRTNSNALGLRHGVILLSGPYEIQHLAFEIILPSDIMIWSEISPMITKLDARHFNQIRGSFDRPSKYPRPHQQVARCPNTTNSPALLKAPSHSLQGPMKVFLI
jgi:hypothetical protein